MTIKEKTTMIDLCRILPFIGNTHVRAVLLVDLLGLIRPEIFNSEQKGLNLSGGFEFNNAISLGINSKTANSIFTIINYRREFLKMPNKIKPTYTVYYLDEKEDSIKEVDVFEETTKYITNTIREKNLLK